MDSAKQRNYFLDNYKALLIVLVLIGHFIEPCYTNNLFLNVLKWVIFSFHMPAFIFISGYFSKKDMPLEKLIQKLAVPYFIFELLYYLLYVLVIHKDTGLYLNRPKFSLWYLMALFFWRIATPYIRRIPGNLFIAVTAGLLIGFSHLGNFFSIPRTLFFYPFFLSGYYFREEWLETVRKNGGKFFAGLTAAVGLLLAFLAVSGIRLSPLVFYGRYAYDETGADGWAGVLIRLMCYAISFLALFALCSVIPGKKHFFSILGVRTMPIYLFHGLIYSVLKATPLLKGIESPAETLLLIVFCILLSFTLATEIPYRFVNWISQLPVHLPKPPANILSPRIQRRKMSKRIQRLKP